MRGSSICGQEILAHALSDVFGVWVGVPQNRSNTSDILRVGCTMKAYYFFVRRNLEVLPNKVFCLEPALIQKILTGIIEHLEAIDVLIGGTHAHIHIGNSTHLLNLEDLARVFAVIFGGGKQFTFNVSREMELDLIQIACEAEFDSGKPDHGTKW